MVNGVTNFDADNDSDGSDEDVDSEVIDMFDDKVDDEEVEAAIVDVIEMLDCPIIVSLVNLNQALHVVTVRVCLLISTVLC